MNPRILLVEDDELIGTSVEAGLIQQGYEVTWEKTGEGGLARCTSEPFDVVILDLMLPGIDGLEVISRLRRDHVATPVLMLTARGEVETKVDALDRGIDDYLTKPFDLDELHARVRSLIRRGQAPGVAPTRDLITIAGGRLNTDARRFEDRNGMEHHLSPTEASLLALFGMNAGRTLTRADIIDEVWGMDAVLTERTVDNFILRLRKLLEIDATEPRHLMTVRGRGYRYEP